MRIKTYSSPISKDCLRQALKHLLQIEKTIRKHMPNKLEHKLNLRIDNQEDILCTVYYNYWPPQNGYHDGEIQLEPDTPAEIEVYSIKKLGNDTEELSKFTQTEIQMIEQMIWENKV